MQTGEKATFLGQNGAFFCQKVGKIRAFVSLIRWQEKIQIIDFVQVTVDEWASRTTPIG
jgi:hypothetical protein